VLKKRRRRIPQGLLPRRLPPRRLIEVGTQETPVRLTDLSGAEREELLSLLDGADSVELKLTVPDADHRSTVTQLGLDPLEAEIRQVFFFDTPGLALNSAGVVARVRRIQGKAHDSVVKLRPVTPDSLPAGLRKDLAVEVDAMPGGYICSATLKRELKPSRVGAAIAGETGLEKLFSKKQRAFLAEHGPSGLEIGDLSILGPIFVLKLKLYPKGFARKLVAEMWLYPDGKRILELSTKCKPSKIFDVAAESRSYLEAEGINLSGEQETKTKTALEFFAGQLQKPA
jgi:hypothetical protein